MNTVIRPALPIAAQRPSENSRATTAFLRLIEWFLPPTYADLPHIRQHTLVFVGSLLVSAPVTFGLAVVAFFIVPPEFSSLPWAVLATTGFALFPFLVKLWGRIDLVASAAVQVLALAVLVIAHFYGGFVSPALPWLMVSLIATLYWLEPWPVLRNINLAVFVLEVFAFILLDTYVIPSTSSVSDHALLIMLFCSSTAVFVFTQLALLLVWSMNLAKHRRLKREIAVREAVEAELRIGREHLARAQALGKIGSAELDLTTGVTTWSSEHYRLLALMPNTPGPVTGLLLNAVHADDRERVAAILAREQDGELTPPVEFRVVRPDDEVRWLRRQPEYIHGPNGEAIGLFVTVQDITEWKRAEGDRAHLERQSFQSQKIEAVGKLAGGIAHDFNNLLSVVGGYLELAAGELKDQPVAAKWIESARHAAERGTALTQMMLTFARRQPLQPMEINPAAIVRDFGEILRRMLGGTIELKITEAQHQWHCEVDPGQLQNALLNLAVNARDAMPSGGTLTIATDNVRLDAASAARIDGAKAGDYAVVSVSDTGVGIEAHVMERVLEPFFTTKDGAQNTGLGLSMVSGFVAQSGGHITIFSVVGRGTTLVIYLPRVPREDLETEAPRPQGEPLERRRVPILMVEDNEEVRSVTQLQLERLGHTVISAATGEDGIEMLAAHPEITLLLCDLILVGGIDGVEVAKRAMALRPDLKVLFMSGFSSHADLPSLGAMGKPRLLRKPFGREELAVEIVMALGEG